MQKCQISGFGWGVRKWISDLRLGQGAGLGREGERVRGFDSRAGLLCEALRRLAEQRSPCHEMRNSGEEGVKLCRNLLR